MAALMPAVTEPTTVVARTGRANKGAKPGERRGGRKAGTPNKATASLKAIAQTYTEDAIATLAEIMRSATEPAAARVSAANSLLDRGYGKPSQVVAGDDEGGPIRHRIIREIRRAAK